MFYEDNPQIKLIITILFLSFLSKLVLSQPITKKNPKQRTRSYKNYDLNIPQRTSGQLKATVLVEKLTSLTLVQREQVVYEEIMKGNVPSFSRQIIPVSSKHSIEEKEYELILFLSSDYLAIGSETDYLYLPLTPKTAQLIATKLNCILPTQKMVDLIYKQAQIKLRPQPIPPSDSMTTVGLFAQHTDSVALQIQKMDIPLNLNAIKAGHKKVIILSNKMNGSNVVIYGWHQQDGTPIQPSYGGHSSNYADYSHGVRLVSNHASLNGKAVKLTYILQDPRYHLLLSHDSLVKRSY